MSRNRKALAVALTAIMVLSVFAYAPAAAEASTASTVLEVDDDHGADHNDDIDNDNEFETIQGAVDAAEPGDRIEVAAGTYNENVMVDVGDVVIEGAGAGSVTVVGQGNDNATVTLGADDIQFRGFTVEAAPSESTPAVMIYDLIDDSHVKGVVVEDNVFVGHDDTEILGVATPETGTSRARDLTVQDNEFTGGTPGSMTAGFLLNATNSVMDGNTFSTSAEIASLAVTGSSNTITNTVINYPGYGFSGLLIGPTGTQTTVDTLSVDGHPDAHLHENETRGDWLKHGVYVAGSGSTLSDVESVQSHHGIYVGSEAVFGTPGVSDVTILDSVAADNRNHDLKIDRHADGVTVDDFHATSSVRPAEDEWSGFVGPHPTSGANVFVDGGQDHRLGNVTSTSESPVGIAMQDVDESTVDSAEIRNKGGAEPDLGDGGLPTTGISLNDSDDNTISNSVVTDNDVGVAIADGEDNSLLGNNPGIYNNTVGVDLWDADDTLLRDNDVQDNGVGLNVTDSDDTDAHYNNFVGNGDGIVVTDSEVDARLNWFGSDDGPSGSATAGVLSGSGDSIVGPKGDITYDPFLTAPKDDVVQDPDKTKQYAHDLVTWGSQGIQTVGTPGPAEVSFQFSSSANAAVWTYESGSFSQVTSPTEQADTLDAYLISSLDHGEHARVVVDFSDTTPSTPGAKDLDDGWNFVTAPQYGATEHVVVTNTDVKRVHHGYTQFASQPAPAGAPTPATSAFSYAMGSSSPGPNLSAYSGYWVYVNGDGEITAAIPAGVTITEEEGLIVA